MCWNSETSNKALPVYERTRNIQHPTPAKLQEYFLHRLDFRPWTLDIGHWMPDGYCTMRTPPLLLGATLLFWGWQTGFPVIGVVMGVVIESARVIKARWEFSDEDFSRILSLCTVLLLGALVYGFTANEGPSQFSHLIQNPTVSNQSSSANASAQTAIALFRWLPMIFFLVAAAQAYSSREEIPWTAISLILRWRWKRARKAGRTLFPIGRGVNIAFPYFGICLFAASSHSGENTRYYWGLCLLLVWALWSQRSRRFRIATWLVTLGLAVVLGYASQHTVGRIQNYITRFNMQFLARFFLRGVDPGRSRTSLGQIGRIKNSGRIVIRLKTEVGVPPTYLREASYSHFKSPDWSMPGFNADLREVTLETNGTQVVLLRGKTNTAKVQIACYLERQGQEKGERSGVLPLPAGCGQLENLPPFALNIATNTTGAVLAEGPGLVIFDACYGPGAMLDSSPGTNDLAVPSASEEPALDQVISELQINGTNTGAALQAVNGFFQNKFHYSTWQEKPRRSGPRDTPLGRFLLRTRSGHCEYFATATVLLLRKLNISARYAVGYAVHEASGKGYVVRLRDAHAWCLVWDQQTGTWQDFDTTPASWVGEETKRASPGEWLSDFWSWIVFQFSKFRWGQTHLRPFLLFMLAPVLVFLFYQIVFRRKRNQRSRQNAGKETLLPWPGRDSEFYLIERKLADRGVLRPLHEPLSNWLERTRVDPALAEVHGPLQDLLRLHYRYRFDPRSLDSADRLELKQGTERVLGWIAKLKRN